MSLTGKVQDRVARSGVVGLGVDEGGPVARDVQRQHAMFLGDLEPERLAVELQCRRDVVDGEAAIGPRAGKHDVRLSLIVWR